MTREEIVKYWLDSSDVDAAAMSTLFANGHYVWALFIGHLVVEKLLKAYYVKNLDADVPQIHHLLRIAEKAGLELPDAEKDFLLEVTDFNIKARYPDYKSKFYKKATKDFAEKYLRRIEEFRQWLLKQIEA